ncbi:MAG: two-component regulator propeller domain-containing protein [Bacteroidota bacterium]
MRSLNIAVLFLFSILLATLGCDEQKTHNKTNNIQYLTDLSVDDRPHQSHINIDSLVSFIPGENGLKLPETHTELIPIPVELQIVSELVPGISNLPQSPKEIREHKQPVKSKKPKIINVDYSKRYKKESRQLEPPIIINIPKSIHLSVDSILYYESVVLANKLISIQHSDTIYPPLNVHTFNPTNIKALPFSHKDYALFDIRILDADQELPNSYVRAIKKDNNGVIWFGTHTGGLISYDGQNYCQYTKKNGLSSDMVISLLIDSKNNIWVGTKDYGLNLFDGKNITQFTKKQGLPSNSINAILEDRDGNIWIATSRGATKFDGKTFSNFGVKQGLGSRYVTSIYEDDTRNIWFGTTSGVTKFNPGKVGKERFITFTKEDGLTHDVVLSITQDHYGNMWIGTYGGGVSKFDGNSFTNYSIDQGLGNDIILSIIEDSYGNIWFGTYGNGVTSYNGKAFSHYTVKEGLSNNHGRTLFDDNKGNLWIGTDGGGVSSLIINSFTHFTTDHGMSNNLALSIFQDEDNRLWFGTFEGGVLIYDEPKALGHKGVFTQITTEHGLADNVVNSIIKDNNGNYWFGTYYNGISRLDGESFKSGKLQFSNYSIDQGLPNEIVRSVLQDKSGDIWFATEGGAVNYDGNKFVTILKKDGLGSDKVVSLYEDTDGAIWFGCLDGGVTRFKNDTLTTFTTKHGLGDNTIWSIIQDKNGAMWFGTNGGGLTCFNGSSFCTLTINKGLSNDYVYSLIIDSENNLWAGTTRGLNQIKLPDSLKYVQNEFENFNPTIVTYGKMDGLKSVDFYTNAALYDNKNRLWWGTSDALSMLDLTKYKSVEDAPYVHLTELVINNKSIDFSGLKANNIEYSQLDISFSDVKPFYNIPSDLKLPYYLNHLLFRFSATEWSAPHQIRYQHKLLGFEKDWRLVSKNNEVDYRNIPPGTYTFMVRAIGKSNKWGSISEYSFTIKSPYWLTWWALIAYVLIFSLSIWLLISWRVNIVKKQKNELENLIYDRTKELDNSRKLAEQATVAKSQFIATMSHEIRTPLNAIMGLTHLAINTSPNPKQEDYLQKIDRSANTLLSLINDILDFPKIEAGKMYLEKVNFDLEILINSIIVLNAQHACKKGLEFVVNINPNVPRFLIGDPLRIGQVITNLVSNAIKFTTKGEVVIQIDISKKINNKEIILLVAVSDTGIGINKDQIPFLFDEFNQADSSTTRKYGGTGLGLTISKKLVRLMNGNIWLNSEPNDGTIFFFDCNVGVQSLESITEHKIPEELKGFSILVCDNNKVALKSLVDTIRSFSLNVDGVNSAEEAIKHLRKKPYELLFIDHQQKGLSGLDTIVSIKKDKSILPLKTILILDTQRSKINFTADKVKIDGYLSKPNIPSIVLEKILAVFGMESMSSPLQNIGSVEAKHIKDNILDCRILLAEDNEINRQVVFELLDNVGIDVDVVENGFVAVEKAKETSYDLILMDLHMPVMDGYTAASDIRKFDSKIPIIAITADAMSTIKTQCTIAGINDIITKPINPDLLYDTVIKWISPDKVKGKIGQGLNIEDDVHSFDLEIKGLDSQSGVDRFGDNIYLYKKMLVKFVDANSSICDQLRILVEQEQFEKAHLAIHTLKGESGNIGANSVYNLTLPVEAAILSKNLEAFNSTVHLLEKSMKFIMLAISINPMLNEIDSQEDTQLIKDLVNKLVEYLTSKNPKAFDLLDEFAVIGISKTDIDAITKAINSNNIEDAIVLLKKL